MRVAQELLVKQSSASSSVLLCPELYTPPSETIAAPQPGSMDPALPKQALARDALAQRLGGIAELMMVIGEVLVS